MKIMINYIIDNLDDIVMKYNNNNYNIVNIEKEHCYAIYKDYISKSDNFDSLAEFEINIQTLVYIFTSKRSVNEIFTLFME